MGKTCLGGVVVVFLLVAKVAIAAAQEPPPREATDVGVMIAVEVNLEPIERNLLLSKLDEALEKSFEITVTSDGAKDFPEGLPETCIAEGPCLEKTAKILKVRKLLLLVVVKVGSDIQIDPTFYDTATKTVAGRPTIQLTEDIAPWEAKLLAAAPQLLPNEKKREKEEPKPISGVIEPASPAKSVWPKRLFYTAGGLAVLSLGIGAYAINECGGSGTDYLPKFGCGTGDDFDSKITNLATGVGILAGVVAVVGGGLAIHGHLSRKSDENEAAVGVGAGPGDLGLAIIGSF